MKRPPGHASVEEHPKGSGLYRVGKPAPGSFEKHGMLWRWRMRINGRRVVLAKGYCCSGEPPVRYERVPNGSVVYFIGSGDLVKIGYSSDIKRRLQILTSDVGRELTLLATVHGGRGLEEFLHGCYHHLHARGEWFHNTADIKTAIWWLSRAEAKAA